MISGAKPGRSGSWGDMMTESIIFAILFIIIWILLIYNRRLKLTVKRNALSMNLWEGGAGWGNEDCVCGTPRKKWKALAMHRPENILLLTCPNCKRLWEEQMSLYGNKWRQVDADYAKEIYNHGRSDGSAL